MGATWLKDPSIFAGVDGFDADHFAKPFVWEVEHGRGDFFPGIPDDGGAAAASGDVDFPGQRSVVDDDLVGGVGEDAVDMSIDGEVAFFPGQ